MRIISNFENSRKYLPVSTNRWQILPPVPLVLIVDTGGNFATGVNDTNGKFAARGNNTQIMGIKSDC